jgi:peptidyl-prolyl cis-trans isomerase D
MFDAVRNNPKIIQVVLGLILLPFAFFGVESYVNNIGTGNDLAKVGDSKISHQDFQNSVREQQERLRASLGAGFKPEMLDTPEARRAILDGLIGQRILMLEARKGGLGVSDEQLRQVIAAIPALQEDGKFSMQRYQQALQAQGMSQAGFESKLRNDLTLQQIPLAVGQSGFAARADTERWVALQREKREVAEHVVKVDGYTGQVKLGADAVQKYYDAHKKDFELPDQAMVEYLVLSQDDMATRVAVAEKDIKAWYDGHADRYKQAEERRASHILIPVAKGAPEGEVKAAQAKAEEALKSVKAHPADFARLAKEYSGDPGSAANGGDLGSFGRGIMVKAFDDAVFGMKEGQVSDLVRSDFGFHIIKLTGIKGQQAKPYAQMHEQIQAELRAQAAARLYAEAADAFTNLVYEQSDSLKPAAEKFKLTIQKLPGWITRQAGKELPLPFQNPKLMQNLFADDAVKNKRNTEAVEVAPNTLVSARVVDYRPASLRPLAEVQADITKKLTAEEAGKLARKEGEALLAALQKGGKADVSWGSAKNVSRSAAAGIAADAKPGIFSASPEKLPAYAGGRLEDGSYVLYRISRVEAYKASDNDREAGQLAQQYVALKSQDQMGAYFASLKAKHPVTINKAALETKDR